MSFSISQTPDDADQYLYTTADTSTAWTASAGSNYAFV